VLQAAIASGDEYVGEDGIYAGVGPRGAALGVGLGLAFAGVEAGADLAEAATADLLSQKGRELVRYRRAQAERRAAEARADKARAEAQGATVESAAPVAVAPVVDVRADIEELRAQIAKLSGVVLSALGHGTPTAPMPVPEEMMQPQLKTANGAQ
jgi:NAD(P)-dependent dehydrogenase (short-subunit alcohol dehydrogenase family)